MKFFPPERDIDLYNEGFSDDILNRAKRGKALSAFLERIDDPLVVALNGPWGSGKTHFLKRWVGAHKLQNGGDATTVYFDAFENDYLDDPLVALLATLSEKIPEKERGTVEKAKTAALKLSKPAANIALSAFTYGATNFLNGLGDSVVNSAISEAQKGLNSFWEVEEARRAAIDEFRAAIEALTITEYQGEKTYNPLIIVVDELDRCRPDYSLKVLEIIKHFFNVPRVHFILGTNMEALENSVKARYGGGIDAESYLKKFVNIELHLPDEVGRPEKGKAITAYAEKFGNKMEIPDHILNQILSHINSCSKTYTISIRDVGKILSSATTLHEDVIEHRYLPGWTSITITLLISKVLDKKIHRKFLDASIDEEEILKFFGTSKEKILRHVDGKINREYDHEAAAVCWNWFYLSRNAIIEDTNLKDQVSRQFDSFGDLNKIHSIPQDAYYDLIDVLNINQ